MPHIITSLCERAGLCVEVCPTDSIHAVEGNADWPQFYIDPDSCIDCGACASECPHEAIFADLDIPAEHKASIQINADFYTKGPGTQFVS